MTFFIKGTIAVHSFMLSWAVPSKKTSVAYFALIKSTFKGFTTDFFVSVHKDKIL